MVKSLIKTSKKQEKKEKKQEKKENNGKLYIYLRVSTKEQGKFQLGHTSLDVQREVCLKKAETEGFKDENIDIVEETYSAKDMTKMTKFNKMLRELSNGDTVYFYAVSRMSRNIEQALTILRKLREKEVKYYFCTEDLSSDGSAAQKLILHNMLATAQYERELLGERVRASIQKRRKMGSHIGKAPYGFKSKRLEDGKLVLEKDKKEQEALSVIVKALKNSFDTSSLRKALSSDSDSDSESDSSPKRNTKTQSYSDIAKLLNQKGYTRRGGLKWTSSAVSYYAKKK